MCTHCINDFFNNFNDFYLWGKVVIFNHFCCDNECTEQL